MNPDHDMGPILNANPAAPEPMRKWHGHVITRTTDGIAINSLVTSIGVLLFAFVVVFFWSKVVVTIPAGHEAVIWRRLWGTDLETVFPEGTQVVFPWNEMTVYDLRLQRRDLAVMVLSTNGLEINAKVSVRFRPQTKTVPLLHSTIGPDYAERIVVPEVIAAVREVMGQYSPQQLYAIRTSEIDNRIIEMVAKQTRDRFVGVDDVLITGIEMPPVVQASVQAKLVEEQQVEQMQFRLKKEELEKVRKRTEAEGIRDFQTIVNSGNPSPATLLWRGIEATLELAKSPNSKVIVVGGKDGLPLILDATSQTGLATPALVGGAGTSSAPAGVGNPKPPGGGAP